MLMPHIPSETIRSNKTHKNKWQAGHARAAADPQNINPSSLKLSGKITLLNPTPVASPRPRTSLLLSSLFLFSPYIYSLAYVRLMDRLWHSSFRSFSVSLSLSLSLAPPAAREIHLRIRLTYQNRVRGSLSPRHFSLFYMCVAYPFSRSAPTLLFVLDPPFICSFNADK